MCDLRTVARARLHLIYLHGVHRSLENTDTGPSVKTDTHCEDADLSNNVTAFRILCSMIQNSVSNISFAEAKLGFETRLRHPPIHPQGVVEEEEDLVITLEGISTTSLAHLTGRFYRWLGKKLPLGADVRAVQVWTQGLGATRM